MSQTLYHDKPQPLFFEPFPFDQKVSLDQLIEVDLDSCYVGRTIVVAKFSMAKTQELDQAEPDALDD